MLISIPIRNKSNHSSFPALSHEEHDASKHARWTWKECGHSNGLGTNRYNMRSTLKRCQTSGSHLFVEWIIAYGSGECWIFGSLIRFVHRCEFALVEWGESGWRAKWGSPTMVFQADQFLRRAPRRAGGLGGRCSRLRMWPSCEMVETPFWGPHFAARYSHAPPLHSNLHSIWNGEAFRKNVDFCIERDAFSLRKSTFNFDLWPLTRSDFSLKSMIYFESSSLITMFWKC